MLARYIMCNSPLLVRASVWLGAEGPCGAKSCRRTLVATSSCMLPIVTDQQQWHGLFIYAAYCYRHAAVAWLVYPCGLLRQTFSSSVVGPSTQLIASDAQQWHGRFIHAAYCYRCAAVAWSVHPRCLLLQMRRNGVTEKSFIWLN